MRANLVYLNKVAGELSVGFRYLFQAPCLAIHVTGLFQGGFRRRERSTRARAVAIPEQENPERGAPSRSRRAARTARSRPCTGPRPRKPRKPPPTARSRSRFPSSSTELLAAMPWRRRCRRFGPYGAFQSTAAGVEAQVSVMTASALAAASTVTSRRALARRVRARRARPRRAGSRRERRRGRIRWR